MSRGNAFCPEGIDYLLRTETLLAFVEDPFNGFHKLAFALHVPDFARSNFSTLCVVVVSSTFDIKGIAEGVNREVARIVKCVDDGEPEIAEQNSDYDEPICGILVYLRQSRRAKHYGIAEHASGFHERRELRTRLAERNASQRLLAKPSACTAVRLVVFLV